MDLKSRNCYLITSIYLYKIIHLVLLHLNILTIVAFPFSFLLIFVSLSTPIFLSFPLIFISSWNQI